ncbi:uncharacterized protein SPSK_00350 [Sporothrix schenckii 1099-18]|uniref:Uncharacterized protein n=1 Tax=Sporothrix schenckii 1099-18 TaxID=1397361 RepID=A0A0F2M2P8_SPOSC|nr:uncharacterized protein SPSK_00350 [Sporothrix schenckii 1099-18]KJR83962.1 hypothetical protein SPSK_00350 [Sporothrix schenckii 1099-18]
MSSLSIAPKASHDCTDTQTVANQNSSSSSQWHRMCAGHTSGHANMRTREHENEEQEAAIKSKQYYTYSLPLVGFQACSSWNRVNRHDVEADQGISHDAYRLQEDQSGQVH